MEKWKLELSATPKTPSSAPILSRRSLIGGLAVSIGLLALGGVAQAYEGEEMQLRPPGGQADKHFWGACIRCDRCRSICPLNAIGVEGLAPSIFGTRLPAMDFREGYCDTCDGKFLCIETCPTGALTSFDPSKDKIGMAIVNKNGCQLYGTSGACDTPCIDACVYDALSLDNNGRLVVDEGICNGCGACEYQCPTSAYRNYETSQKRGINVEVWHG